jgi:hypothetical protein
MAAHEEELARAAPSLADAQAPDRAILQATPYFAKLGDLGVSVRQRLQVLFEARGGVITGNGSRFRTREFGEEIFCLPHFLYLVTHTSQPVGLRFGCA